MKKMLWLISVKLADIYCSDSFSLIYKYKNIVRKKHWTHAWLTLSFVIQENTVSNIKLTHNLNNLESKSEDHSGGLCTHFPEKDFSVCCFLVDGDNLRRSVAMPFMIGPAPIRRTYEYLNRGKLFLKNQIKILSLNYNDNGEHHKGAR